jgi:hypothetical protein
MSARSSARHGPRTRASSGGRTGCLAVISDGWHCSRRESLEPQRADYDPLAATTPDVNPCKRVLSFDAVIPWSTPFRGTFGLARGRSVVVSWGAGAAGRCCRSSRRSGGVGVRSSSVPSGSSTATSGSVSGRVRSKSSQSRRPSWASSSDAASTTRGTCSDTPGDRQPTQVLLARGLTQAGGDNRAERTDEAKAEYDLLTTTAAERKAARGRRLPHCGRDAV